MCGVPQEKQTKQTEAHEHVIAAYLNGARRCRIEADKLEKMAEEERAKQDGIVRGESMFLNPLERLLRAVEDDSVAISYVSVGQYRTALINSIRRLIHEHSTQKVDDGPTS